MPVNGFLLWTAAYQQCDSIMRLLEKQKLNLTYFFKLCLQIKLGNQIFLKIILNGEQDNPLKNVVCKLHENLLIRTRNILLTVLKKYILRKDEFEVGKAILQTEKCFEKYSTIILRSRGHIFDLLYTKRLFVRVNYKNGLFFSIIRGMSEKYPTCVYIFVPERSIGLCGV